MKYSTNTCKMCLSMSGLMLLAAFPAWAVIPFNWVTNGSGVVTDGSWTGNGTIQNNITPGTFVDAGNPGAKIAVTTFSSGVFGINTIGGTASGNIYGTNRILTNPLTATHSITLTGGTADLRLHNSNTNDGGASLFNSVGLTNFAGVTSISWTTTFNQPIAGRNDDFTNTTTRGMGAGLALITAGSGLGLTSFDVNMQYTQIFQENALNTGFNVGVPITATPLQNIGFGTAVAGATSFHSDSFAALNQFLLVRGYNVDLVNGYSSGDEDEIYMRQMQWTIRRDDNLAFASDTLFVMSMDGQQYANYTTVPIPEPTSILLLGGSLLGGCLLRRRCA